MSAARGRVSKRSDCWRTPPDLYARLAESAAVPVCMLLPADPSVRWWSHFVATRATEVRFLQGRVRFLTPEGEQPRSGLAGPSAIVIFAPSGGPPRYTYMQARVSPQVMLPLD